MAVRFLVTDTDDGAFPEGSVWETVTVTKVEDERVFIRRMPDDFWPAENPS